jgi:hypothetical protein
MVDDDAKPVTRVKAREQLGNGDLLAIEFHGE